MRRRMGWGALWLLLVLVASGPGLAPAADRIPDLEPLPDPGEALLLSGPWLGAPTPEAVHVSVVPAQPIDLYVEYGPQDEPEWRRTPLVEGPADRLLEVRLTGLESGRRYAYRLRYRPSTAPGSESPEADWLTGPEHRFHAARPPGSTFRFAFATDSHIVNRWVGAQCGRHPRAVIRFRQNLANIAAAGVDFVVLGGDEVMTHAPRRRQCLVGGESLGGKPRIGARQAHLRYRVFRHLYGTLAASHPVFLVLGNHDGEAAFGGESGACGHGLDLERGSRRARLAHLTNPARVLGGDPDGGYYAFEWGDALFVVLDVLGHTERVPRRAEDWTLGERQLRWLERTLEGSDRAFKLVFAHHLVGGLEGRGDCYHYARGGAFATRDGTLSGPFLGEQERIDGLMRAHGAQVFFHGHDHLYSATAKPSATGAGPPVHYVCGGVAAGTGAVWSRLDWVEHGYGTDEEGRADVVRGPGFVRVEVRGPRELVIQYVRSDPWDPRRNGEVLDEIVIPAKIR